MYKTITGYYKQCLCYGSRL